MRHLFISLLLVLLSNTVAAQEPNTLVLHQRTGSVAEEQIPVEDINEIEMTGRGVDCQMNVHLSSGASLSYMINELEYMDFKYVEPGPKAVDLGLSVLWAECNVGANSPEEFGDLFSWGETAPKSDYSESNYLYYSNYSYQYIGNNISGTKYDAATTQWGDPWRMPNRYEINELMGCEWVPENLNGVKGYRVIGKNGNSIFLPAAGYSNGTERIDADKGQGYYWSSAVNRDMPSSAYNINFRGYDAEWTASRSYGFSIRPVKDL